MFKWQPSKNGTGVDLIINGKTHHVNGVNDKLGPNSMLVDYIRDGAGLKGTKFMCREGGCGACVVSVRTSDPVTGQPVIKAVNSCLTPVLSCNGWDISTVEKVGSKDQGYHPIQKTLAKFNGSQCGFCSPGMVMSMYSLLESKSDIKVKDVEDSFDGNICRCTGYRPILDAFKSFATDAPEELRKQCSDIEDCAGCPRLNGNGTVEQNNNTHHCGNNSTISLRLPSGEEWVQAFDLNSVFTHLEKFRTAGTKCRLVAGNTGTGVFKNDGPYGTYLCINNVPELSKTIVDKAGVVLGGGVTLTVAIQVLKKASALDGYHYAAGMSKHLERVANVPVRNVGTLAGNLMMKHAHPDFQSDVFVLLETVGAKIQIESSAKGKVFNSTPKLYTMLEFLDMDMNGKLIVSLQLPQRKDGYEFRSFKITRRYQNAHAYVNAGFLFKVDPKDNYKVLERPRIVFGGISAEFSHATATEQFFENKCLGDESTLKGAVETLEKEVNPDHRPAEASTEYRKSLTISLLYKTIIGIIGNKVQGRFLTGGRNLEHGSSTGKQTYVHDVEKSDSPLYKSVQKLEALPQVSGEAEYINDIPPRPDELCAAFVLSTVANADLKSIDASEALKMPGVVRFVEAKDIVGPNTYMSHSFFPSGTEEPIFAKDKICFAGQSLGLILAESREIAFAAVKKVKVIYDNVQKPIVDIRDAVEKVEKEGKLDEHYFGTFPSKNQSDKEPEHSIKGEFSIGSQYHFYMETLSCICIPKEDGMDVFSTTQYIDHVQPVIADAIGVPNNNINVHVRRLGGGFGGKASRNTLVAAACAVAAHAAKRSVRLVLDLETNMNLIGKRFPHLMRYEVGFDDTGKVGKLKAEMFGDLGFASNEPMPMFCMMHLQNVYAATGWELKPGFVNTNTPSNTACRAPETPEAVALIETIMEHIAYTLKKDPLEVRAVNYLKEGDPLIPAGVPFKGENFIPQMIEELKVSGEYEARKSFIEQFNKDNRWIKRGMSMVPVSYPIEYHGARIPSQVVIYHTDGSVAVSHGGIEMGQGINTKVAQTVAHFLNIPLDKIQVKPTNNFNAANGFCTGGSITSELCCDATLKTCEILVERMRPIKEKLENPTWEQLVEECYKASVNLSASYMHSVNDGVKPYHVWLVNLTEVEVDILTGEYKILRTDLIEDAGKSLSPLIDIGQIEGGQIMGYGLWTTERITYDKISGKLLTSGTWDYKPPESKDIPEDNRITLLRNAPNPYGVLSSKATGEPSICGSVAVLFAIKNAIASARRDAGNTEWCSVDGPVTSADVIRHSLTSSAHFVY